HPRDHPLPHSFPTRRSSDLLAVTIEITGADDMKARIGAIDLPAGLGEAVHLPHRNRPGRRVLEQDVGLSVAIEIAGADRMEARVDRKITRLNSSHVAISYAV